jgi:aspartate-semialdehyde dehydrogenase
MSRPLASRSGTARLAVVGAATGVGHELREALAESGVPGSRVNLYGAAPGEALLSEYAGEARLIQDPSAAEIAAHDVVFLCERGSLARAVAAARCGEAVILDLAGCLDARQPAPVVHPGINPDATRSHAGCLAVPHPLAVLLAELLVGLERGPGLEEVVATVLRPASDYGEPGIEELREQTVRLLSFAEVPLRTFRRQLAFNILTQHDATAEPMDVDASIAAQVSELLGWSSNRLALRLLVAPLFYGHCASVRFRPRAAVELAALQGCLADGRFFDPPGGDGPATPLEASTQRGMRVGPLAADGIGGFELWVVAGELAARRAELAVRLAGSVGDL